ncbi:MAG: hypothetical protein ACREX4_12895 [Gammaproteobacteria bacterium]
MNACTRLLKPRPPALAGNRTAQQRRFNTFREEFNHERPHEALAMNTPASLYQPSPRPMPSKLPPLDYPGHFEVRYVSFNRRDPLEKRLGQCQHRVRRGIRGARGDR